MRAQIRSCLCSLAAIGVLACDCIERPAADSEVPESWITIIAESGYGDFYDTYQVKSSETATTPLTVHVGAGRDFTVHYGTSDAGGVGCVELDWAETTGLSPEGAMVSPGAATRKDFNAVPECRPGCAKRSFLVSRDIAAPGVPTKYEYFLTGTDVSGNASRPRTMVVMHGL
jgi:hypothetical protein